MKSCNTLTFKRLAVHQCFAVYWLLKNLQLQDSQEGLSWFVLMLWSARYLHEENVLCAQSKCMDLEDCWASRPWDSSSIIPVQKITLSKILSCPLVGVGVLTQVSLPLLATRGSGNLFKNLICALGDVPCPGIASLVPAITHSNLNLRLLGADGLHFRHAAPSSWEDVLESLCCIKIRKDFFQECPSTLRNSVIKCPPFQGVYDRAFGNLN